MKESTSTAARAAAPGRPKQGPVLSEAEAGHKQSSGLFIAWRGAGPLAQRGLQGRSPYSASGVSQ